MPDTGLHEASIVAERLRCAVELLVNEPEQIAVTASIGVVEALGGQNLNFDTLLNRADEAMYHSKHTGRYRVTRWVDLKKQP